MHQRKRREIRIYFSVLIMKIKQNVSSAALNAYIKNKKGLKSISVQPLEVRNAQSIPKVSQRKEEKKSIK